MLGFPVRHQYGWRIVKSVPATILRNDHTCTQRECTSNTKVQVPGRYQPGCAMMACVPKGHTIDGHVHPLSWHMNRRRNLITSTGNGRRKFGSLASITEACISGPPDPKQPSRTSDTSRPNAFLSSRICRKLYVRENARRHEFLRRRYSWSEGGLPGILLSSIFVPLT